jgi:hypothetical protein
MPLKPTEQACHAVFNDVGFAMKDGERIIGVLVTHEAIQIIERPPPVSDGEYIDRCVSYRSNFEAIARDKYDAGQTEMGGAVVRIVTDDILH